MKVLYLDCFAGMAGDMFAAALLDVGADEAKWRAALERLGLEGVKVALRRVEKTGLMATKLEVLERDQNHHGDNADEHDHEHRHDERHHHEHHHDEDHRHEHHQHHGHRGLRDVLEVVARAELPSGAAKRAEVIFTRLAEAEAAVHGQTVDEVQFHEVGAVDAIVDVVSAALLLEDLAPDRVVASPVRTGFGAVRAAHGVLPVPAPATARLLVGIPCFGGEERGEFLTPTGAAILATQVDAFGALPPVTLSRVGAGAGTRDAPFPNVVRAMIGEAADGVGSQALPPATLAGTAIETLVEVEAHVDDMDGQALAHLSRILLDGPALDVALIPVQAKKARPGHLVRVLGPPEAEDALLELLFVHSSTLGARVRCEKRVRLLREEVVVETPHGPVRAKRTAFAGRIRIRPEHDEVAALATRAGLTLAEARDLIRRAAADPAG